MYVSLILPHICRTLVPEIRVHPEILCVFRYIDMLTCVIYSTEQQGRLHGATCVCLASSPGLHVQTHGINRAFSLLRQWSCSCLATCQCTCVNQPTATLTLSACVSFVDVEQYRLTVLRHHWHCSYCHNIISSGFPPVFHECTTFYEPTCNGVCL